MKITIPLKDCYKGVLLVVISILLISKSYSQAPANDLCVNDSSLTSGTTCTNIAGTVVSATLTAGDPAVCTGTVKYDVWYTFVALSPTPTITLSAATGTNSQNFTNPGIQILSGSCGSLTSISCNSGTTFPRTITGSALTVGATYYLRVYSTSATAAPTTKGSFNICITIPNPANDFCSGATSLTVGAAATSGTLVQATASTGISSPCGDSTSPDVWYNFTASSKYPIITLSGLGANLTTAGSAIQLFSGSCASMTSLGCANGLTLVAPGAGLTSGNVYYIRVYSSGLTSIVTSGSYTFKIAVSNPTATTSPSTGSPTVDYGKSYVNITKGLNGGTVEPGDTLEIRATFVVKTTPAIGTAYNCSFTDNIPTNTTYIPSTLRTLTNEGAIYQQFGDGSGDNDGGTITGTAVTINMGIGATATAGGYLTNKSKPSFYTSSCIMVAAYRVVVNPAATYGTKIPAGLGSISYNNYTGTVTTKTFAKDTIMVYQNYGICSNTVGTNAITSEFGGTFGSGKAKNRTPSSKVPSNYTDTLLSANSPQDYYYGVTNNTSTNGTGYTTLNTWLIPDPTTPISHRIFNLEDIIGDHTNATNPLLGNPPADTVASSTGGYMVFINASYRTDTAFLDTISNLCPNTFYQYSAWFRNMCSKCGCDSNGVGAGTGYVPSFAGDDSAGVRPNLTFNINGYDYYTTGDIKYTGQWIQKGFTYQTSGSQTSMIISVRNNAPGGGGNDWVIDDIGVATCSPSVSLTPNKPDTLCQGADDTVRFKVSSYFNNFTQYYLEQSLDNGVTWTSTGTDTTGAAATGSGTPVLNPSTGLYEYTLSRYYQLNLTDTLTMYRLTVASSVANLSNTNCSVANTTHKLVYGANCMSTLPVNIVLFKGTLQDDYANLQWVSSNETGEITYTVERSDDQVNFEPVGTLQGTALPGSGATYNFTDPKAVGAATYYRIAISSHNFRKYSNIILLSNTEINFELKSLVNPFSDVISFDLTVPADNTATFTLIDMFGRIVKQDKQNVTAGLNSIKMYNLANLSNSTYTLQVQYTDKLISKHVIKLVK